MPADVRNPLINEWLTVNTVEWVGSKGGYDQWALWGYFGERQTPFKLMAYPEHRRAIYEAGHDVSMWPGREKRGKRIPLTPVTVLACWNKGLSFSKVEPARAGVGD